MPSSSLPRAIRLIILALAAFLLAACGPHRIVLPKEQEHAFEDHGIEGHILNWTRLTLGPYDVRRLKVRPFHRDSSLNTFHKREHRTVGGQRISFTLEEGGRPGWMAECTETEWQHRIDTLDHFHWNFAKGEGGFEYEGKGIRRRIEFDCRFRPPSDTAWPVTLRMSHPAREGRLKLAPPPGSASDTTVVAISRSTRLMVGLHPNHAAACLSLVRGLETLAMVDETWSRIYLEKGQSAADKTLWAAVLTALWVRQANL